MANRLRRWWTFEFLRELFFVGDARLAADWVGVSHSHVWMRRLKEPKFAGYWDAAMRLHGELVAAAEARARDPSTIPDQVRDGPPPCAGIPPVFQPGVAWRPAPPKQASGRS